MRAVCITGSVSAQRGAGADWFDRAPLHPAWTFHAPDEGQYEFRDGWIHVRAPHGLSLYPLGDGMAPTPLIKRPADEEFSFDTRLRWIVAESRAEVGPGAIRKDLSAGVQLEYIANSPEGLRLVSVLRLMWWIDRWGMGSVGGRESQDIWLRVGMMVVPVGDFTTCTTVCTRGYVYESPRDRNARIGTTRWRFGCLTASRGRFGGAASGCELRHAIHS